MENSERFSALYLRDFRLLWTGQLISFTGTWMHSTAQGWLVYSLTGSPFYLGMVAMASSLPVMLFTLFGGVVADRVGKRNLLIVTQAASIVPAVAVGVLASLGVVAIWHLIVLAAALGTMTAFYLPARHAFVVEVVGRGRLLNAVALTSAAFNGSRLIGPVIAGLTIAYVGIPASFYLNGLSFLVVVVALSRITERGEARVYGQTGMGQDLLEGMRFVFKEKEILIMLLLLVTFSVFGLPFVTLLPVFAEDVLGVGAQGLGFLSGSAGLGALLAALNIAFRGEIKDKVRHMTASALLFPLALMVFSFSKSYYLSMALLALAGWGLVGFIAVLNSLIQLRTPDGIRGRVMSVYTLLFLGMTPVGNAIMGTLAEAVGTTTAVTAASAVCLAAAGAFAMTKGFRRGG